MTTNKNDHLVLYYFDSCPFCQKVLKVIRELNIQVDLKNIHKDPQHMEKLMEDTGRKTVPCLYINDKPMHESSEIVKWLKEHYS